MRFFFRDVAPIPKPAPEPTFKATPPPNEAYEAIKEATRQFRIRPVHLTGFYVEEVTWANTRSRSGGYQNWVAPPELPDNLFAEEVAARKWIVEALKVDSAANKLKREENEERARNYRAPYRYPPPINDETGRGR